MLTYVMTAPDDVALSAARMIRPEADSATYVRGRLEAWAGDRKIATGIGTTLQRAREFAAREAAR